MGILQSYVLVSSLAVPQSYLATTLIGVVPLQALGVPQSYLSTILVIGSLAGLAVQGSLTTYLENSEDEIRSTERTEKTTESEPSKSDEAGDTDQDDSRTLTDDLDESGVIYARVSSQRQATEGTSLREQVRNLQTIAEKRDIELVREPILDEGETGMNFDRNGIQQVTQLATEGEISYVLVDDVDRVGRHAAETLFYLYELREECGVTIITAESGELDVETFEGLMHVMLKSLSSQMANENRARRAHAASVEKFKQKNWSVFFDKAPFGYRRTDDDWLAIDSKQADIVHNIFETFLLVDGAYQKTVDSVDDLSSEMSARRVKRLLQKRVYIGEPTVDTSHPEADGESKVSVIDPDLQIITEDIFDEAQAKIEAINERYSTESDSPDDVDDFVSEFGKEAVVESSPIVELQCPECGNGLAKNGQRTLSGRRVHNYLCSNCGLQRKFPQEEELSTMKRQRID